VDPVGRIIPRMFLRLFSSGALGALIVLSLVPAPAQTAAVPTATATPLKTIKHVYATRLCTGLRRSIGPAVRDVLQNDRAIAISRPLFQDYVKSSSTGSQGAVDMDVMRMEKLIGPLVSNTQAIEKYLNDSIYPSKPQSDQDRQLLQMRAHLADVLAQQKQALDLVSGFVDTQQLGQLRAAGHEYDKTLNNPDTRSGSGNPNAGSASPTSAPAPILNAGVNNASNDPGRASDPRYLNTGSQLGYNPLNIFDQRMEQFQTEINKIESLASQSILKAVPMCGGQVAPPTTPSSAPASPVPSRPLPSATSTAKP